MKTWATLIRREFWEYRSLWIVPLAGAAFLLLGTLALAIRMEDLSYGPSGNFPDDSQLGAPYGITPFEVSVFVFSSLILLVGALATLSYAFDCLYAERKDGSILFWKSLPVSDRDTVLSKAAVALLVMPLGLALLVILTNLLSGAILSIHPSPGSPVRLMWEGGRLLHAYGKLLGFVGVNVLWYAPVVAYAMLASVLSGRMPLVMSAVPLIILGAGEKILFDTSFVGEWVRHRLVGVLFVERALRLPELWIGLLVAAAVFALVIRLRRWRDDS